MIKFACPNGHQLSAPENLSGKGGKCPKCSTPFVVPSPEVAAAEASGPSAPAQGTPANSAPAVAENSASTVGSNPANNPVGLGSGKENVSSAEVFVFLCPNGHRLNGPPTLKGKAGQCPHCGAKFRIPSDDDLEEDPPLGEAGDEEIPAGEMVDDGPGFNFADFGRMGESVVEDVEEVEPELEPPPPGMQALGYIIGRLWDSKSENTEMEVFLNEGEIMAPEFFSEILSSSDFGVFASQDGDGSFSLTVVPWAHVRKVSMRKIGELSPKMFR